MEDTFMKAKVSIALAVVFSSTALLAQENNSRCEKIREVVLKKYDANGSGELDESERAMGIHGAAQ